MKVKKILIIFFVIIILIFGVLLFIDVYKPKIFENVGFSLGKPYCVSCYYIGIKREPKIGDYVVFNDKENYLIHHKVIDITKDGYYLIASEFTINKEYERYDIVKRDDIISVDFIRKIPFVSETTNDFIKSCLEYPFKPSLEYCIKNYNYYKGVLR